MKDFKIDNNSYKENNYLNIGFIATATPAVVSINFTLKTIFCKDEFF